MNFFKYSKLERAKIIVSCLLVLSVLVILMHDFWQAFAIANFDPVGENKITENYQVFLLAVACLVSLYYGIVMKTRVRCIPLFFSFLFYSFIMREVDFEDLGLNPYLAFPFHDIGRNVIAVVVFSAIIITAMTKDFRAYLNASVKIAFSKWGVLMMSFLGILIFAQICEHSFTAHYDQLWEEMFELIAYCGFAVAAIDPFNFLDNFKSEI